MLLDFMWINIASNSTIFFVNVPNHLKMNLTSMKIKVRQNNLLDETFLLFKRVHSIHGYLASAHTYKMGHYNP